MKALGLTARRGVTNARDVGTPSIYRQTISDSQIIYGEARVGGKLTFFHPKKGSDGQDYRYFAVSVAGHRCKGVKSFVLNDEIVTVNPATGAVTSGDYAGNAWLWFERGAADAVAHPVFVAECDGRFTESRRGRGIAKFFAKFRLTDAVIAAGMPNMTVIVEGKDDIRDPRDGTVGYTDLAIPIIYDWFALPREEGGFGAYADEIPDDDWLSAVTNVCDEDVAIPGPAGEVTGLTEKRYTINGMMVTGAAPNEVRDALMRACAGSYTYSGGFHKLRPGYWVPPSETLHEGDLVGPITSNKFDLEDQRANEVQGTYADPKNLFQAMPLTTQTIDAEDVRQMDYDGAFVTSKYQGERVARIMLRRAGCERRVTWPMNIVGIGVETLDTVMLDTVRQGLGNYAWVVKNWGLDPEFNVVLGLREENEDIYADPETHIPSTAAPAIGKVNPATVGGGAAPEAGEAVDGAPGTVTYSFTMPARSDAIGWYVYRNTGSAPVAGGLADPDDTISMPISGHDAGDFYTHAIRYSNGAQSPRSAAASP